MLNTWIPCPLWEADLGSFIWQPDFLKWEICPGLRNQNVFWRFYWQTYTADFLGLLVLFYFIFQQVNGKELRSFYFKSTLRLRAFRMWYLAVPTTVKIFTVERKSDFSYVKCLQHFSWCEDHSMNVNAAFIRIWISRKYKTFFLFASLLIAQFYNLYCELQ